MEQNSKKIVLLGHVSVGKTSLIRRFVHDFFSEKYVTTIGVTIEKKDLTIEGSKMKMIIWDIEGQAMVENVPESYLLGVQGIFYVFDLSRKETRVNLKNQLEFLRNEYPFVPIKIIGNKLDLINSLKFQEIEKELQPLKFEASSALTGENVEKSFMSLAKVLTT